MSFTPRETAELLAMVQGRRPFAVRRSFEEIGAQLDPPLTARQVRRVYTDALLKIGIRLRLVPEAAVNGGRPADRAELPGQVDELVRLARVAKRAPDLARRRRCRTCRVWLEPTAARCPLCGTPMEG